MVLTVLESTSCKGGALQVLLVMLSPCQSNVSVVLERFLKPVATHMYNYIIIMIFCIPTLVVDMSLVKITLLSVLIRKNSETLESVMGSGYTFPDSE